MQMIHYSLVLIVLKNSVVFLLTFLQSLRHLLLMTVRLFL